MSQWVQKKKKKSLCKEVHDPKQKSILKDLIGGGGGGESFFLLGFSDQFAVIVSALKTAYTKCFIIQIFQCIRHGLL